MVFAFNVESTCSLSPLANYVCAPRDPQSATPSHFAYTGSGAI